MPAPKSLVAQLLTYAAAPADRRDSLTHWHLGDVGERQLNWVLQGGLGPLLHYATREHPEAVPAAWRERLLQHALTARVRHADRVDVACEVIEMCAREGVRVTLLKGISTSEQFYPAAYLRPMADIDLLVPERECHRIESVLKAAGYRPAEHFPDAEEQHHGPPLRHPARDVWVEIHRSLFPSDDEFSFPQVFRGESIAANSEAHPFHGVQALRLTPQLQLIYIASSWMRDLMLSSIQPSFLASIFDAVFLVGRKDSPLEWTGLMALTGDDMPTAALHSLVSYLDSRGLIETPPALGAELAARGSIMGSVQLRVIHTVLDHHLIGGRAWDHALPVPVVGRYSIRRQWDKRVHHRH
jgi:hypothetical protein